MTGVDLVTGGAGFVGAHLCAWLVRSGRTVRVVDDISTGRLERLEGLGRAVELVRADLATAELGPVVAGVERMFHLAAVPSVPRSVSDPLTSHQSIATATLRLLVAARDAGVSRVVLSSSSSVYGDTETLPKHEALPLVPVSPYGVAKVAADAYARVFASLYGLCTISLRYFNVFGPDQDPGSPYAAVIPRFVTRALAGQPLVVHGDGLQTRDFTYVDNVVQANLLAADADVPGGRAYNIAGGESHSVLDLVRVLEEILGRRMELEFAPPRPGDIRHSFADVRAAREELGWSPRIGFAEGVRRTVDWFRRTRQPH